MYKVNGEFHLQRATYKTRRKTIQNIEEDGRRQKRRDVVKPVGRHASIEAKHQGLKNKLVFKLVKVHTVKAPVFGTLNSAISNFQTWFVRTVMEVSKYCWMKETSNMQCNYNSFIQIINFHGLFRNALRCRKSGACRILVPLCPLRYRDLSHTANLSHILSTQIENPSHIMRIYGFELH